MLKAAYLSRNFITRAALVCAFSFGLGSAAMAAESEASSLAGAQCGSLMERGATVTSGTEASVSAHNESSEENASHSSTERSSSATGYNSSLKAPASGASEALINRNLPATGIPNISNQNGLIQNNIRQNAVDLSTSPSVQIKAPHIPHAKVQYWNQGKSSHTKLH